MRKKYKPTNEVTILGYLTPSEWDDDDNVVSVAISTDDDYYVVELNGLGEELFDILDEDVEVTGIVEKERDGTNRITVTSYEVLSEDDYEEDEGWGYDEDEEQDPEMNRMEFH